MKKYVEPGRFVLPGDRITLAEAFYPGPGTYEDDGVVRAAVTGTVEVDLERREVRVKPLVDTPPKLRRGVPVIGRVQTVKEQVVLVRIDLAHDRMDREPAAAGVGGIHISRVRDAYVEDLSEEFQPGDIVRAKVISVKTPIQLSTMGEEYGVILAYCSRCRSELERIKGRKLRCPVCGHTETRKVASGYLREA
ncbi:MAG: exosome complex RNA-binding protein Csl4 [Euryarchaeota archaeon]